MRSTIYNIGESSTPREKRLKHASSQQTLQQTSKTHKPSSVFKSNKLISLSELLLTDTSDHKNPPITPSNNQQLLIRSTTSLLNFKKANPTSPKIIQTNFRETEALKQQIRQLNAQLYRVKNQKSNSQRYQEQASLQIIKNLNLKVSVKSTLIEKIAKSLNNFRQKIAYQNIKISPQCECEMKQLLQMINNHENSIRVKENVYYPSQKNKNKVVIVYREGHNQKIMSRQEGKQQKNWQYNNYIRQLITKIQQLQRTCMKSKQELKISKIKIQKLQQKLIQNGFQLHTMDMIKQKWKQAQQKLLKIKFQGENPEKDSNTRQNAMSNTQDLTLRNQVLLLKRQKQMFMEKEHALMNNIKNQQIQRSETINHIAQEKNNIINKLTTERNDFFNKWKQALQQIDMLKIKCNIYARDSLVSVNSRQIGQFTILQQKISSLKRKIRQYEQTIVQLQQSVQTVKLKQTFTKSSGQINKQTKDLTKKYKQLQIERDFLIEIIKRSQLNGQNNSILQKVLTEKQTLSQYSRFQQILNSKQRNSIRSFSENKVNEKEFYRYKVDQRYLDLKRKINEIHHTYAHGNSAITFFKKYTQKEQAPENKGLILQMIRDALAILNKFQQTIIIKKSQLKRFNQNKIKDLGTRLKKTKQQNITLRNEVSSQLNQFKREMDINFTKIGESVS